MMKHGIGTAILALAATIALGAQQWQVQRIEDDFTGETTHFATASGEELAVSVACVGENPLTFAVHFRDDDTIFGGGEVAVRWDEDPIERHLFQDANYRALILAPADGFVGRMTRHSSLRLRVTRWPREFVDDHIGLAGAAEAVRELPCAGEAG